jgi:tripartite-type tricarboxylate transporter receptor subunit TctC
MKLPSCLIVVASIVTLAFAGAASAQNYPSGPVTILVPFSPGGTTDIMGRIAAEVLQKEFKQNVIVENRTGAGGVIANSAVARAAPDGQLLLLAPTAFAIVPFTNKSVSYDPARDLQPITLMGYTANVMVVSPSLKVNSVKEFIEYAKTGHDITYASPGLGTPTQLGAELFAHMAGIKMRHVPYRGAVPAVTGLMAGEATMMFVDLAPALPLIEAGRIKPLGMATPQRHPKLPNLPTVAESLPGYYLMGWQGLFAPGRTPDAIVDKINAALVKYLKTPDAAKRMDSLGVDVKWTTPAEMRQWVDQQLEYWGNIARNAGIKPQ